MKKSKLFKTISFSSLALLMGAAGVFAFAPLGASPNNLASANEMVETTTEQGLITPKADDPVIYTTESGLEIKWGNALTAVGGGNETMEYDKMTSGNLNGFPYFTTTSGSTTYTWVIIGKSTNISDKISYDKLSNWQTKTSESPTFKKFFESTYEAATPAGLAIKNNNLLNDYTARKTTFTGLENINSNSEIPSGCVLVLANDIVGSCVFNSGGYNSHYSGMGRWYSQYNYDLRTTMEGYYTNSSFGLGSIKSQIVQQKSMSTKGGVCNATYVDQAVAIVNDNYIFPLSGYDDEVFYWGDYLTANQIKLSSQFWLRSGTGGHAPGVGYYVVHSITTSGTQSIDLNCKSTSGIRPAFVLKIS